MTDIYEPGSTFKVVTFAAALNEGVVTAEDRIYCENGRHRFKGRRRPLHDTRPYEWMSVREVLQKSSNIGTVKIALKLGEERLHDYIKRFGFGKVSDVCLLGEIPG